MSAVADTCITHSFTPQFIAANPKVVATVRKGILTSDAGSFASAARMAAKADLNSRLAPIHCPTLVLVGAQDSLTPPELAKAVVAGISGAQLHEIPDSRHAS